MGTEWGGLISVVSLGDLFPSTFWVTAISFNRAQKQTHLWLATHGYKGLPYTFLASAQMDQSET